MRRLWAHIIIAFTCLVTAFAVFPTLIKGITTNGDYRVRREFTFQLSQREAESEGDAPKLNDDSAKEMASIMESRLISAGVSSYEINTAGNDIVNVSFAADNYSQYNQITTYLSFSGSFALVNTNPDGEPLPASEFIGGTVYLKSASVNEEPTVIIPVNTESEAYKSMIQWTRDNPTITEQESQNEDEDPVEVKNYYVYILYNYVPGDTYKSLQDSNKFQEKVLLTFDVLENDDDFYYDLGNGKKAFSYTCSFSDGNSNETLDSDEVKTAYDQANYIVNLFSASALDYDVKLIKGLESGTEVYKNGAVENLFSYSKIALTSTLIASIAAFVITALLLVVFYRLGALSVITTSTVSVFLAFLFMIVTGLEFNSIALLGLVLVAGVSVVSGIIYNSKLKDETYKGRSLKKANLEASKKSTLPILDVHIVSIVIGLLLYLLGGTALHTFASILLLGSLASLLLNLLLLRGMMWLATNTTALTGKYEVFAIDSSKVPNHMAEEKQSYFGAYAEKDLTKKKKPVGIVALAAFVVGFAGVVVGGVLNNGNLFKSAKSVDTISEVYFVNTIKKLDDSSTSPATRDKLDVMLANLKTYTDTEHVPTWEEGDKTPTLADLATEINEFTVTEDKTDEGTTTSYLHTYFEIKLKSLFDQDKVYLIDKDGKFAVGTTIKVAFEEYFEHYTEFSSSVDNVIVMKSASTYVNAQSPDWTKIALSTSIALLVLTLYMMIRYRLSRGLATLVYPFISSTVILGFFALLSLVGLALPASIAAVVPAICLFSYVFMILIMNKERDMLLDERVRDNTYEHRVEVSKKALGISFTSILAVAVIGTYLFINFFGFGPAVNSYMYLAGIIGLLVSLGFIAVTYVPLANLLFKWFSGIQFSARPTKKKKNVVQVKNSAEPQEAIFIGIND